MMDNEVIAKLIASVVTGVLVASVVTGVLIGVALLWNTCWVLGTSLTFVCLSIVLSTLVFIYADQ